MEKRTTDHVGNATTKFFEEHKLNEAAVAYFAAPFIQGKIDEGHKRYHSVLDAAEEDIPEGAEEFLGEVLEKHTITREAYEQDVFETFKEKFKETFALAAVYVPIAPLLVDLLNNPEDENQLELLLSAMDDILESMTHRIEIIVRLRLETGMPLELAEKIADDIGDGEYILGRVEIVPADDEEEDDDGCGGDGCACSGECGGHCDCEGSVKCKETGHCQCEDGCKCNEHADE